MQIISDVKVNDHQFAVYKVLEEFGPLPDHALVPIAQHILKTSQSSSGIRTRRSELVDLKLVQAHGETETASGRKAATYAVVPSTPETDEAIEEENAPF